MEPISLSGSLMTSEPRLGGSSQVNSDPVRYEKSERWPCQIGSRMRGKRQEVGYDRLPPGWERKEALALKAILVHHLGACGWFSRGT